MIHAGWLQCTLHSRAVHVAALVTLSMATGAAQAQLVGPGYDLFRTPYTGNNTQQDSRVTLQPPLVGVNTVVFLEGVPVSPADRGDTDTIVERCGNNIPVPCPLPFNFAPNTTVPQVPVEIVALHLKSVAPIQLALPQFPAPVELHFTIDRLGLAGVPDGPQLPRSIGTMEIQRGVGVNRQWRDCFGTLSDSEGVCGDDTFARIPFPLPGEDPDPITGRGIWVHAWAVPPGQPVTAGVLLTTDLALQRMFRTAISCTFGSCKWIDVPPVPDFHLPGLPAGGFYPGELVEHDGPHREIEAPQALGGGVAVPLVGPLGLGVVFLLLSLLGIRAVRRGRDR